MAKIGLFYGSDTGSTEMVAAQIVTLLGTDIIDCCDVAYASRKDLEKYDHLIIGLSTWYSGDLQSDWDDFYKSFKKIDFKRKKVAFFGLGDQVVYGDYFIDGVGILSKVVKKNGGEIIGKWSTEGYMHNHSKAEKVKGWFSGLAIDEENQSELTNERIITWTGQLTEEFNLMAVAV